MIEKAVTLFSFFRYGDELTRIFVILRTLLAVLALGVVGFIACSDDDDDERDVYAPSDDDDSSCCGC